MNKFPITPKGKEKLLEEIKHLKSERQEISHAIAEARDHGDLSENAEYQAAREHQSLVEAKLLQLESMLANLNVIDITTLSDDSVKFGATVTLLDEETLDEETKKPVIFTYTIVGEYEADITNKRISIISPIAKALIGKKMGETIEVFTPKGTKAYTIEKIAYKEIEL